MNCVSFVEKYPKFNQLVGRDGRILHDRIRPFVVELDRISDERNVADPRRSVVRLEDSRLHPHLRRRRHVHVLLRDVARSRHSGQKFYHFIFLSFYHFIR